MAIVVYLHTGEFRTPEKSLGLWRKRIDDSVHGSSCPFDHTVRNVLGCICTALRHVFRRSHRSGLNRANGNGEGENDRKQRFHSTNDSFLTACMRLPAAVV
jgi:hypothetical protein